MSCLKFYCVHWHASLFSVRFLNLCRSAFSFFRSDLKLRNWLTGIRCSKMKNPFYVWLLCMSACTFTLTRSRARVRHIDYLFKLEPWHYTEMNHCLSSQKSLFNLTITYNHATHSHTNFSLMGFDREMGIKRRRRLIKSEVRSFRTKKKKIKPTQNQIKLYHFFPAWNVSKQ